VTLTDYAADLRAPTPTAAAELVAPLRKNLEHTLDAALRRVAHATGHMTALQHSRLALTWSRCCQVERHLERYQARLRLPQAPEQSLRSHDEKLASLYRIITSHSCDAVLARGFALVLKSGNIVSSASQLAKGDAVELKLGDGKRGAVIGS